MWRELTAVFIGSGIGGACRFLVSDAVGKWIRPGVMFPWGTFAVNVAGCFVIGLVYGLIARGVPMSATARLLLTTGFCGGLTTFSTFSHENFLLFDSGHFGTLLAYALSSLLLGWLAAWFGHWITN